MSGLRRRGQTAMLAALVCACAVLVAGRPAGSSSLDGQAAPGISAMLVAYADGTAERVRVGTGEREAIPAEVFRHLYAESMTQLAVDRHSGPAGRLWYSDSHTAVRSIDLATLTAGETLGGFADSALVGCATTSEGRPLAVDPARRRLFVPIGTGGVLVYDVDSLRLRASVSAAVLETEPGLLPALAVDSRTGALWYGSRTGEIVELDGMRFEPTGRRLAYSQDAHVLRSLAAAGGTLVALDGRGAIRAYDLVTEAEVTAPAVGGAAQVVGVTLIP